MKTLDNSFNHQANEHSYITSEINFDITNM